MASNVEYYEKLKKLQEKRHSRLVTGQQNISLAFFWTTTHTNRKSFYAYVRNRSHAKHSVGPVFSDNQVPTEHDKMAEEFNIYFTSVYCKYTYRTTLIPWK